MAHRKLHYYGRGQCRYGPDEVVKGTLTAKEITKLYELKHQALESITDEDAYEDALEDSDDYFMVMSIMEELSAEDFAKVVNGGDGAGVWAEEVQFGLGGTITKAKIAFAEIGE